MSNGTMDEDTEDALMHLILEDIDGLGTKIPEVEHPPTLEEILNEEDNLDYSGIGDDLSISSNVTSHPTVFPLAIPAGGLDSDIGETLSVHSHKSRGSSLHSRKSKDSQGKKDYGSIMRHVILKGISAQVCSAVERVNAGSPTCMTTTAIIAVGTQHGFIMVFDSAQVIKWFLGSAEIGQTFGAVSSLCINSDSSRLLAGFARGNLMEFDLTTGKTLKTMNDIHPQGSAILHTRYTDDPNFALICDSGGSVFELNLRRGLRGTGASSRCIFSGSRGEVCTLEPLHIAAYPGHPLSEHSILALATISKIIVITVRPKLRVLLTTPLVGDPTTLPLLCWQFVVIQTASANKVVDPVLTFARQSTIHFYQVTMNLSDRIVFVPLQRVEVGFNLLSLSWLNTRCLGLIDSQENLHLLDVRTQESLETIDLTDVELVYGTQFFKGLATGGNVSAALSLAGEMAAYNSTTAFTNQLLILGKKTFHVLIIRTWADRLDHLVKENKHIAAMELGIEFYQDQGKALVGLRGTKDKKKQQISIKLVNILKKFLDISLTKNFPSEGGMATLTKYFNEVVPPCVDLCMVLGRSDLLFSNVWNSFQLDPFSAAVFLESLEPYILSDQLSTIPPNIVQEFMTHYDKRSKHEALEASVTHLSVACLDIHQIMSLCRVNGLYDAIIYIYNNAMLDFITPAEELLTLLRASMAGELNDSQVKLGNKLLVYISCCLAGRAYPIGDIAQDMVAQVKYDVYNCITQLHSRSVVKSDTEPPYPHLHTLLSFDTQGFLNVLSIAFEEAEFQSEVGQCQKQRLVDILLEIMVKDEHGGGESVFSATQVGYLFTFLARQLARGDACLSVSRDLFSRVLIVLTSTEETKHAEERQQALLDMIAAGGLQHFDREKLLECCEKVGFYRILETLYEKAEEHDKIFDCYIADPTRQIQIFSFIQNVFVDEKYSSDTKKSVKDQFVNNLPLLITIDCKKTAMVVFHHCSDVIPTILANLRSNSNHQGHVSPETLYDLLTYLLEYRENSQLPSPTTKNVDVLGQSEVHEEYIELMCRFHKNKVSSYLKTKDNYRTEAVIEICDKYDILDAKVYLLEKMGMIQEAFNLMKEGLDAQIKDVLETIHSKKGRDELALRWTGLNTALVVMVQLCQRVSPRLDEDERESIWCPLLDTLMQPLTSLTETSCSSKWREMVRHLMSSMLGYVSHGKVLTAVMSDPGYSSGSWADLRQLLAEMLAIYRYEEQLAISGRRVIEAELGSGVLKLVKLRNTGDGVAKLDCCVCGSGLASEGQVVVFSCKHGYHTRCVDRVGGVALNDRGEEVWSCFLCHPTSVISSSKPVEERLRYVSPVKKATNTSVSSDNSEIEKVRNYLNQWRREEEPLQDSPWTTSILSSELFKLKLKPVTKSGQY